MKTQKIMETTQANSKMRKFNENAFVYLRKFSTSVRNFLNSGRLRELVRSAVYEMIFVFIFLATVQVFYNYYPIGERNWYQSEIKGILKYAIPCTLALVFALSAFRRVIIIAEMFLHIVKDGLDIFAICIEFTNFLLLIFWSGVFTQIFLDYYAFSIDFWNMAEIELLLPYAAILTVVMVISRGSRNVSRIFI